MGIEAGSLKGLRVGFERVKNPLRRVFLAEVFERVRELFQDGLISFVIFGSVARGEDTPASDTDVLIVLNVETCFFDRVSALSKILNSARMGDLGKALEKEGYNTFVEFYPLSMREATGFRPIYLDMVNDAIILHDRGSFFVNLLAKIRVHLEKLGAVKVRLPNGDWCWMLKPDIKFGEEVKIDVQ